MQYSQLRGCFAAIFLVFGISASVFAQNPGDTIRVRTFHYGSNTRDTVARFPSSNLSFEKIIMRYNMRCKNGLVSNSENRNLGCGEWDYSCNTYIVDSSKIEEVSATQARYQISNFAGQKFLYSTKPVVDYYQRLGKKITVLGIESDTQAIVNPGNGSIDINFQQHSGRFQVLIGAAELRSAGFSAGPLNNLSLNINQGTVSLSNLKVSILSTKLSSIPRNSLVNDSLITVFNGPFAFAQGLNRINFLNGYTWDGLSNLVIDLSWNNPSTPAILQVKRGSLALGSGLFSDSPFSLDLSNNAHIRLDTTDFSSIRNELTISFWVRGNEEQMPISTTILYGYDANPGNRHLNIHLPHSSNNVYFDAGFSAGSYDRINKIASASEQGGQWNHWVFTKNSQTGIMKIFLNGKLWHSGTGKTKPLNLLNLMLGKDQNLGNNYKGRIRSLGIWNKSFPDSVISTSLVGENADFSDGLVSYYKFNEGKSDSVFEYAHGKWVIGNKLQWTAERGENLVSGFMNAEIRPEMSFGRTVAQVQVIDTLITDSVIRPLTQVIENAVISKQGQTPLASDEISVVKTDWVYAAFPSRIYTEFGNSWKIADSIAVLDADSLIQSNLNFKRRFPWYNEIMSFVTPYGIGLNLGPEGKTWYFDVTDFAPILKGDKRILMTLGGQNQEQNDVEFWFIVGTPVRPVLEFNQIWQGTPRAGNASLTSINNNSRYAPVQVPLRADAKTFKMRSTITGHGAEGEFKANGGQVDHMLNIDGGTVDYTWSITRDCSYNPVFPQGGTWLYDREGWCPGEASLLKENDLTPLLTPGQPVTIDYEASVPPKEGGAYNYVVAHQLVSYGDFNFSNDARILEVIKPSDKILYGRSNPICAQPEVVVQNSGSGTINSIEISYWINSNQQKQSYTWNGTLMPMQTVTIQLPLGNLYNQGMLASGNQFFAELKLVNGKVDDYTLNNRFISPFNKPEILPSVFKLEFYTNRNPNENSFRILDENGKQIDFQGFSQASTLHSFEYNLGGCYKIIVEDTGLDGLSWWANSSQGTGFMRIRNSSGTIIKTFQPDFGKGFEYSFTTNWALGKDELEEETFSVFPNPVKDQLTLDFPGVLSNQVAVFDIWGRQMEISKSALSEQLNLDFSQFAPGVYLITVNKDGKKLSRKIIKE